MVANRDGILDDIRRSQGRDGPIDDQRAAELRARMASPTRNLLPARADLPASEVIDLFQSMAESVFATVDRVADMSAVPEVLTDYLKRENLPAQVVMAPDPSLDDAPWSDQPLLEIRRGVPQESDMVSVTSAPAAIAETGTLAMFSGADHPSTLNFLPETHVVVLPVDRISKNYEDVWDLIRQRVDAGEMGPNERMPRTVNLVTGPSRSGDIEQTLLLGAHGPRRLHIILVDTDETA
ncbi:MAG: lactate utilization protein C [Alphaproteobacteria bacterium]|nr:lactate utilization protein C [Alphaproteobacteria bacterium]